MSKKRKQNQQKAEHFKVSAMDVFRAQASASRRAISGMSHAMTTDGFENFISRIGLHESNSQAASTYDFNLITRNRVLLEAAYRGSWIVGAAVDCRAEDMTREGVTISTSQKEEELKEFNPEFTRLKIWQSLKDGIAWGRLYGGGLSVMNIKGQDLASPLDIDTVGLGQFEGLSVFDRWMLNPVLTPIIESGPDLGMPKYYQIVNNPQSYDPTAQTATGQLTVHYSRVFRHGGIKLPFFQAITELMWDESVLERVWDRLVAFDNATLNAGALIDKAYLRMMKIQNLREISAAGGEAMQGLIAQFDAMRLAQVNEGLSILDKDDEFATESYTFTGIPEIILQQGQQLSGALKTPLVRLFGQSPVGLNSTGEADIRMYYDGIKADQEAMLRPQMDPLIRVMWKSKFGTPAPEDLEFTFNPLWQMSAKDKTDIAKSNTETVSLAHEKGFISTPGAMKELRGQAKETGLFNNITDEDIEEAELEPAPLPDTVVAEPKQETGKFGEKTLNESEPVHEGVQKKPGELKNNPGLTPDAVKANRVRRWRWFKQ
jgi:uncharacterized protein